MHACSYGDDVHDLSVMHYINFTWLMSNRMVKATRPVGIDISNLDVEAGNWKNIHNEYVGEAWEDDSKAGDGYRFRGRGSLSAR